MVQWTDKPAPKPQAVSSEAKPDAAPRPVVRKARKKGRLAGMAQVLTICCVFGLIVASVFMFREMRTTPSPPTATPQTAQERNTAAGRIVVMDREQCRELGFDNQSGKMIQKGAVACHDAPAHQAGTTGHSLYRHPINRLEHIRRSFAQ